MDDIAGVFEKYADDFLCFELVVNPRHPRPDLCAFLMLDDAFPNRGRDMIIGAEHDEIWLDVTGKQLFARPELIRDLVRCGVRYDAENDCLAMFV